jgi:hypothetical protein
MLNRCRLGFRYTSFKNRYGLSNDARSEAELADLVQESVSDDKCYDD